MNGAKRFLNRWKTEYDWRTFTQSLGSFAVNVFFALYNGFLGVRHSSLWHGSICAYYLFLVLLRGGILAAGRAFARRGGRERAERKTYLAACGLLLLLNVSLIVPISLMVVQQKPVYMTLIPAIAMAAYTTYKITMASIHLRRRRRTRNRFVRLLRTVSFIDALVSILTLQNTLIMVSSNGGDMGMLPLTAASSAAVWLSTLGLSAAALAHGIREGTG